MRIVYINGQVHTADLPLTNEVTKLYIAVASFEERLREAEGWLDEEVKKVQSQCSHEWIEERRHKPRYGPWGDELKFGADLLVARFCPKCTKFESLTWMQKWNGYPYWVCRMCLGNRTHTDISLQPLVIEGRDYTRKYTCQECDHVVFGESLVLRPC